MRHVAEVVVFSPAHTVRFGSFELDLRAAELRHNGTKTKLPEQPFQILCELLEHPGEVVTRDELRQRLWTTDTFVDFEHGLNTAVKRLRELLDDSAERPRYIETVPRHGYRLIVEVQKPERTAPISLKKRLRWRDACLAIAALVVAVLAAGLFWRQRLWDRFWPVKIESLAVLPLENLSGNPEQEYFADGITEALITEIGKMRELRVISHQSVMHYKGTNKTVPEIATELGVDAVIEGSAFRSGNKVRITAQFIQAHPERHLWSESYERDLSDVLGLQQQITQVIAGHIRITLTPQERGRGSTARPVNNEAYDAYLQGLFHWNKRGRENLRRSAEYFQKAIAKDPDFAPPYAKLAWVYRASSSGWGLMTWSESRLKAMAAANKALELDSSLAEAHAARALILSGDYEWRAAEIEYRLALDLDPGSSELHYLYGFGYLLVTGRYDEAIGHMRRALELDPFSLVINANFGSTLVFARRFDEAIRQCQKTLEMDPSFGPARQNLAAAYQGKGMLADNLAELQKLDPDSAAEGVARLARAYALLGRRAEALKVMKKVNELSQRGYVFSGYDTALIFVALGERDQALAELQRAYVEHSAALEWLRVDWRLDEIRSDPRYKELLRRMNFPPLPQGAEKDP
jgi:TolB-like protein/DNA-binding winged helix-turn-helix (wHTH) protein/Tfp pilus assembly protein PilF